MESSTYDSVGVVNHFQNDAMQIKIAKAAKQRNTEMVRLVTEALRPTKLLHGVERLLSTSLIHVSFRRS